MSQEIPIMSTPLISKRKRKTFYEVEPVFSEPLLPDSRPTRMTLDFDFDPAMTESEIDQGPTNNSTLRNEQDVSSHNTSRSFIEEHSGLLLKSSDEQNLWILSSVASQLPLLSPAPGVHVGLADACRYSATEVDSAESQKVGLGQDYHGLKQSESELSSSDESDTDGFIGTSDRSYAVECTITEVNKLLKGLDCDTDDKEDDDWNEVPGEGARSGIDVLLKDDALTQGSDYVEMTEGPLE